MASQLGNLNFAVVQQEVEATRNPKEKARLLRKLIFLTADDQGRISVNSPLFTSCLNQYQSIVDSSCDTGGLDNYASSILRMADDAVDSSKSWTSSIVDINPMKKEVDITCSHKTKAVCLGEPVVLPESTCIVESSKFESKSIESEYRNDGKTSISFGFTNSTSTNTYKKGFQLKRNASACRPDSSSIRGGDEGRLNRALPETEHSDSVGPPAPKKSLNFVTAKQQLLEDYSKRNGYQKPEVTECSYGVSKKSLGTVRSRFVPPTAREGQSDASTTSRATTSKQSETQLPRLSSASTSSRPQAVGDDTRLEGLDANIVDTIMREVIDCGVSVSWDDIAGLDFAKSTLKEIIVYPMLRPDIFTGLRGPPRGLLLFGPPGTGKSLIGRCIASVSGATFFSISASSLTSKWMGDGEKLVRALFTVARTKKPSVIFIDEVDSLLSSRSESEHEASRRMKTEFLVQFDGVGTESEERLLVIGATNRPQELDEAARRRFVKRLYIPLPEAFGRAQIIKNMISNQPHNLTDACLTAIVDKSEGYSGADVTNLVREAAMGPVRSIPFDRIQDISMSEVRSICFDDFIDAFTQVRASVSQDDLHQYLEWNNLFGSYKKVS